MRAIRGATELLRPPHRAGRVRTEVHISRQVTPDSLVGRVDTPELANRGNDIVAVWIKPTGAHRRLAARRDRGIYLLKQLPVHVPQPCIDGGIDRLPIDLLLQLVSNRPQ